MRVVTVNLKHSANLGDRLISECLLSELRAIDPSLSLVSADLAGRDRAGQGRRNRVFAMATLKALPRSLRALLAEGLLRLLAAFRLRPMWRRVLANADAVVLGGGNLLADSDLNFPIKVSVVLEEAARRRLAVGIFAVGVSPGWTPKGQALFGRSIARVWLVFASVRDEGSQLLWQEQLDRFGIVGAGLALDPGLLTARHYPRPAVAGTEAPVGICLTSPIALDYHAIGVEISAAIDDWYIALGQALLRRGHKVLYFATGSSEDVDYLERVIPKLREASDARIDVAPPSVDPAGLVALIGGCKLVMAHRLHACIPAYSYGVPSIGFTWDPKMTGFFHLIGYPERLIDPSIVSAEAAADCGEAALRQGVDADRLRGHVERAREDVAALVKQLRTAVEQGRPKNRMPLPNASVGRCWLNPAPRSQKLPGN